jgi:hypothetical protein
MSEGTGMVRLGDRISIAREEFITLVLTVQRVSDSQLEVVKKLAAAPDPDNVDSAILYTDLGNAVSGMKLIEVILQEVMTGGSEPEEPPTTEGGHQCHA